MSTLGKCSEALRRELLWVHDPVLGSGNWQLSYPLVTLPEVAFLSFPPGSYMAMRVNSGQEGIRGSDMCKL